MQSASRAYKNSIRQGKRNRGYIKVEIGVVNSTAQRNIEVSKTINTLAYFSNPKLRDSVAITQEYATAEENFSRVDGSQYFLPPQNAPTYYESGVVTQALLGSIKITFGTKSGLDIKGLTIDFSENYPTRFTISNGTTSHTYDNDTRHFVTEDVYNDTAYFLITPIEMLGGQDRLRIYAFGCGIANTFTNDELITYSSTEYVSAICETIPSNDVHIVVDNKDLYFCPENPNSAISYMEIGQEVKVAFGYDVNDDGNIEWLPPKTSYLKSWSATESEARFDTTDRFDNINSVYYGGVVNTSGITLYDLAIDVLEDGGIEDYFLDTYLQNITVYNPIPPVDHASALQIIANAGRCTISEDRQGRLHIQSNFIPDLSASSTDETAYSHAENIISTADIKDYAEASLDYSSVNGDMYFIPSDSSQYFAETSYISDECADADGYFENNPKLNVEFESAYAPFELQIDFRETYPRQFTIRAYLNDVLEDTIVAECDSTQFVYDNGIKACDRLEIEFTNGAPHSRVFVDRLSLGMDTDYHLQDNSELDSHPISTLNEQVKSVSIGRTTYATNSEQRQLASEKITLDGDKHVVYFNNPCYGYTVSVVTQGVTATITDSSAYFVEVTFTKPSSVTEVEYTIEGYEYTKDEQVYLKTYGIKGKEVTWNNPLISTVEHAQLLEEWVAEWYKGDIEYDIEWRGDPRVDANDLFYMDNVLGETVEIRAYQNTLNFSNQGWSGEMKARKVIHNELDNT